MPTITIPTQVRQGLIVSPAVTWPGRATGQRVTVQIVLPVQAERDNPASRIDFAIEFSKDSGSTWKPWAMAGWSGGAGNTSKDGTVSNPPPALGPLQVTVAGALVRLAATVPTPLTLGATVVVQ